MVKKLNEINNAQGTIEYLIVIAVVVVIGLVVVSLLASTADTQNLATTTGRIDTQTRSGIVITEAAADLAGESLLLIRNNDPEEKTLTKITIDGKENNFEQKIQRGQEILIKLEQLETNCKCEAGQTTKTCTYQIEFTSRYGITTTQTQTTTITCEENISPTKTPISPVSFGCFNLEKNPIEICSIYDLNKIRDHPNSNFILLNDINATETKNWDNGKGWKPIETFSGILDGDYKKIQNLQIFRYNEFNVALFKEIELNSKIENLILEDINFFGSAPAAIVANSQGIIENTKVSGKLVGSAVGGFIFSAENSTIKNSYIDANMHTCTSGVGGGAGGLIYSHMDDNNIINTYSTSKTILDPNDTLPGYETSPYCDLYFCSGIICNEMTFYGGLVAMYGGYGPNVESSYFLDNNFLNDYYSPGPNDNNKTETEFKQQASFVNWDFTNIWKIDEGNDYPRFIWE